jgi:hypothetical protein
MVRYWADFVKTGDPNGPGLPAWTRYETKANDPLMHFNNHLQVQPDERTYHMKKLDAAFQSGPKRGSVRGVSGSGSQTEHKHGHSGEAGVLQQLAEGESDVVHEK